MTLYISEIVTALLETAFKAIDVALIVKLCACLHRRYEEFTDPLITGLRSSLLANPNADDPEGAKKRRIQVRFLMELFQEGIFTDDSFFVSVLMMLLGKGRPFLMLEVKVGQVGSQSIKSLLIYKVSQCSPSMGQRYY